MRSYEEALHPVGFVATQIVDNELAVAPRMVNDFPQESFICSLLNFVFTFRHVCSCLYENINVGADQNILVRAKKFMISSFITYICHGKLWSINLEFIAGTRETREMEKICEPILMVTLLTVLNVFQIGIQT